MAEWAKIKFFYDNLLAAAGTLAADSTESTGDYDVDYIHNMLEKNFWQSANTTNPQYIEQALTVAAKADYLIILGHNLNTIGATIDVEYSATGAWAGEEIVAFSEAPSADTVCLKRFTSPGSAQGWWRIKFSGAMSAAPYMAICMLGLETELEWVEASFDPHAENVMANRSISYGGFVTGVHTQHTQRIMQLTWRDMESALYNKLRTWWDVSGLKNFFVAWDNTNNAADVYLMYPSTRFSAPFTGKGDQRNITVSLTGRKE